MSSEADLSLLLSTVDSTDNIESKSGRGVAAYTTWVHTRKAKDGEPETINKARILYCKYCTEVSYGVRSTSAFRHHLLKKHNIEITVQKSQLHIETLDRLQQLYQKAEASDQTKNFDTYMLQKILNKDLINEALVSLITVRNLSFRMVEWPEFRILCQLLNPESDNCITTAHSEIRKMIYNSWQSKQDIVRKKLQSALSSIHLSVDIWTSPNNLLLLGICAHFIEQSQEKLSKALLALRPVASHSGEEQFNTLLPVLQDYGIVRHIGAIISDNHTANDKLCRTIGQHLLEKEGINWNATHKRIRCNGHIINLAVQAFLFQNTVNLEQITSYEFNDERGKEISEGEKKGEKEVFRTMGSLRKLHNIVVYIRSSPTRTKEFEGFAQRRIPLDNRTRWNSWYKMLKVAITLASAIDDYTKKHFPDLEEDYLYPKDWESLRTISEFLQPFHKATLLTQGDNATIDLVLFTMDVLIKHFKEALVSLPFLNNI